MPGNSNNLGNVRITLPSGTGYDAIDGNSGVVVIVEGVGTSELGQGTVGPSNSRLYVYGVLDTATGEIRLTDTMASLDDPTGDGASGDDILWEDSDARALTGEGGGVELFPAASTYEYARFLDWRTGSLTVDDGEIVFGVSTLPGDVPTADTVTYTGDSLIIRTVGSASAFNTGTSEVTANFGSGTVDAEVSAVVALFSGGSATFTMEATGMSIDGNSFAGGTVDMTRGGGSSIAADAGSVQGTDAAGLFFGPATDGPGSDNPAEVGGFIQVDGSNASFRGYFIGDNPS